jgi:hypothetical protein
MKKTLLGLILGMTFSTSVSAQIDTPVTPPERDYGDLFQRAAASRFVVIGTVIKDEGISKRMWEKDIGSGYGGKLLTISVERTVCRQTDFKANQTSPVTSGEQQSASKNFYVQTPSKMVIVSASPASNLPPTTITDGNVVDAAGNTHYTHQCGAYRNYIENLLDQRTPGQNINGTYTIVESFNGYTSTFGGTTPQNATDSMTPGYVPSDIQYLGKNAPSCFGSNDHEEFDQYLTIQVSPSISYALSTVNHIKHGNYSGVATISVTNTTP